MIYNYITSFNNKKVKVAELGSSLSSCFSGDTNITINNKTITVEEYIKNWSSSDNIKTFNEKTLENTTSKVLDVKETGIKQTYTIELENGEKIELTDDHLVMTRRGWVIMKDLSEDDEILYLG